MILDLISQSVLEKALGNSEDNMPNKIKEKEESLQNTLNNRLNIPILAVEEKETKMKRQEDYTTVAYPDANNDYTVEPTSKVEPEINTPLDDAELNGYTVSSIDVRTLLEGDEKPINVKEHMILNMMKKSVNDFTEYHGLHESVIEEAQKIESDVQPTYEEHIVNESKEKVDFEEPTKDLEKANTEIGQYGIPVNIEKALSSTFDFDNTMVAIHQTREEYKNVSEKANMAAQAANESEELLQKVSSEYSEAERQLKEKEKKSMEMEKKIISILNSEKDRINQQMQEKESLINDANKRKEQNDDKIVDFRSKIDSAKERVNEIDERISRQEELLNTLVGFNINLEDYNLDDEEKSASTIA